MGADAHARLATRLRRALAHVRRRRGYREERWRSQRTHLERRARRRMVPMAERRIRARVFRLPPASRQGIRRRQRETGSGFRWPGVLPARTVLEISRTAVVRRSAKLRTAFRQALP